MDNKMENKYYWISVRRVQKFNYFSLRSYVMMDIHPFQFIEYLTLDLKSNKYELDITIEMNNFREITKSEYDLFIEVYNKKFNFINDKK